MPDPILNAKTKRRLLRVALTVLDSPELAEEVVQEAYLRFLESEISAIENPSSWLYTVTRNLAIDRARRMIRERELIQLLPGIDLSEHPDEAHAVEKRLAELISSLLRVSGSHTVSVVLLHVVFGLSYEEIANICGRTPAACRQIASRALRSCFSFIKSDAEYDVTPDADVVDEFVAAIFEASMTPLFEKLHKASTVSSCDMPAGCDFSGSYKQRALSENSGMRQVLILKPDGVQWALIHNSRVLCVLGSAAYLSREVLFKAQIDIQTKNVYQQDEYCTL